MAVLARRNWSDMLTETTLRLGNPTTTGFDGRIKYFLAASYYDLCTTFHHVELDASTTLTCSTSVNTVNLPADCFVPVHLRLRSVGGTTVLGPLLLRDYREHAMNYGATSGQPSKAARFGNAIHLDVIPNALYVIDLAYYKRGTAPDFSTPTSPELDSDVDEHIIEGAIRRCFPAIARPDLGDVQRQLMTEWMGSQVRASILDPLATLPEGEKTATTYTKGQG